MSSEPNMVTSSGAGLCAIKEKRQRGKVEKERKREQREGSERERGESRGIERERGRKGIQKREIEQKDGN